MKRLQTFLILFFVFIFGMMVAAILFHYGVVVKAQEGCGEWVFITSTEWNDSQGIIHHRECGWVSDSIRCPDSVWIPKPCPDNGNDNYLRRNTAYPYAVDPPQLKESEHVRKWKFSHFMFEVWDKQPCNPGGNFKLWCPPSKLDSSVVREAICEEDYYMDNDHILGYFPCYCLIVDGIRYWMKENPLKSQKSIDRKVR